MKKILFLVAGVVLLSGCQLIHMPEIKKHDDKAAKKLEELWPKPSFPGVGSETSGAKAVEAPAKWFYKAVGPGPEEKNIYKEKNEKRPALVPGRVDATDP